MLPSVWSGIHLQVGQVRVRLFYDSNAAHWNQTCARLNRSPRPVLVTLFELLVYLLVKVPLVNLWRSALLLLRCCKSVSIPWTYGAAFFGDQLCALRFLLHVGVVVNQSEGVLGYFLIYILAAYVWSLFVTCNQFGFLKRSSVFYYSLICQLVVFRVVLWDFLSGWIHSACLLRERPWKTTLLGYETILNHLANIFSFWILPNLAKLVIFELTAWLFRPFVNKACIWHDGARNRATQVNIGAMCSVCP